MRRSPWFLLVLFALSVSCSTSSSPARQQGDTAVPSTADGPEATTDTAENTAADAAVDSAIDAAAAATDANHADAALPSLPDGSADRPPCVPISCQQQGATCGTIDDLCGKVVACGTCKSGLVCQSATHTCVAVATACGGTEGCGFAGDSCGNSFACAKKCAVGSKCVNNACVPCSEIVCTGRCGVIPNGCGATSDCGACPAGLTCDAVTFTCAACQKKTCASYPTGTCGTLSDGCGGVLSCACPTVKPSACTNVGADCGKLSRQGRSDVSLMNGAGTDP